MRSKRKIVVFSAGCPDCEETVALVRAVAGDESQVIVHNLRKGEGIEQAKKLRLRSLPAVVIDGRLFDPRPGHDRDLLERAGVAPPSAAAYR
jgi:hypothetical protein